MRRRQKQSLVVLIVLFISSVLTLTIHVFAGDMHVMAGWPEIEFRPLRNGTYTFDMLDLLPSDKYAVYARRGSGTVEIDGQRLALDDGLFKTYVGERKGFEPYSKLFAYSPKITIRPKTIIIVEGDKRFLVGFLKNDHYM